MIYTTRYQAQKAATNGEVTVKLDNGNGGAGYTLMTARDYQIWRKQK